MASSNEAGYFWEVKNPQIKIKNKKTNNKPNPTQKKKKFLGDTKAKTLQQSPSPSLKGNHNKAQ